MSRVNLTPKNPDHEVVVGLDKPLSTFFISVSIVQDDDDLEDLPLIEFQDRWDRHTVIEKIDQYAVADDRTKKVKAAILMDIDPAISVMCTLEEE